MLLDLTSHDGHSQVDQLLNFGRNVGRKNYGVADVESADEHVQPQTTKFLLQFGRVGELVGLYPNQTDDSLNPFSFELSRDGSRTDPVNHFIEHLDVRPDIARHIRRCCFWKA